jgi:hypothetical protein
MSEAAAMVAGRLLAGRPFKSDHVEHKKMAAALCCGDADDVDHVAPKWHLKKWYFKEFLRTYKFADAKNVDFFSMIIMSKPLLDSDFNFITELYLQWFPDWKSL